MSQPKFSVRLPGSSWSAVVTEDGSHFYHNTQTRQTVWRADDEELRNAVASFDRRVLLLLVAKARGLKIDESGEELVAQAQQKDTTDHHDVVPEEDPEDLPDQVDDDVVIRDPPTSVKAGLVSGYSSSEDSDSEDEDEDEPQPQPQPQSPAKETERPTSGLTTKVTEDTETSNVPEEVHESDSEDSSDDGNGFDLAELDGISSDEDDGQQLSTEQAESSFFELLQRSSLDPFSPWETESLKIVNDPRFLGIDNNKDRKRLFDTWCTMAISIKKDEVNQGAKKFTETPFVEFLRFLESKECDRFYADFKKKWKDELETLELSDREKEKFYKEYVILGKKSQLDKEKIFKSLLTGAKIFKKNLLESEGASETLDSLDLDNLIQLEANEAYGILHELEEKVNISPSITQQTKYFLVDIRTRIRLLVEVSRLLLG